MQASRILETALYVRDVAEAIKFYRDIIGLEPVGKVSERNAFFRCGDGILLLFKAAETLKSAAPGSLPVPPHGTSGPGHVCFAATCHEIDDWRNYLEKHDIAIESDFEWPNGARSIYFRDPSGNSLEFAEPKLWS
ncbi:VOC family protein [Brucella thiophenivorans]|uniref:Lactoylglutathione lyase n=1 Tax=Brucella thiophenivorans TaxID=571255 RepID=A0A256FYR6_9HYPH|nr:VOC family protein [Brucella thiophenivorans]OYR19972.1 lactoylglutathione lyase [Brucella thiophenivorans]